MPPDIGLSWDRGPPSPGGGLYLAPGVLESLGESLSMASSPFQIPLSLPSVSGLCPFFCLLPCCPPTFQPRAGGGWYTQSTLCWDGMCPRQHPPRTQCPLPPPLNLTYHQAIGPRVRPAPSDWGPRGFKRLPGCPTQLQAPQLSQPTAAPAPALPPPWLLGPQPLLQAPSWLPWSSARSVSLAPACGEGGERESVRGSAPCNQEHR